jgi:hypothetical protein
MFILIWQMAASPAPLPLFFPDDQQQLEVDEIASCAGMISISVSTAPPSASCPACGIRSVHVHSRYYRLLRDLLCQGSAVRIRLRTRRYYCRPLHCDRRVFTERFPAIARVMNDNHISCRATIKIPGTVRRKRYKSKDLYGERSGGKASVARSAEVVVRSSGGEGGYGCKDCPKVPASATATERDAAKTHLAHSAGLFCGCLGTSLLQEGQLRTLQRRMKNWRALEGPPREVFFAQEHDPGELCQSDFTHCRHGG